MRYILGFLSGLLGMLAGWFGLAFLVVSLAGHDRDGGIAMGAFFNIGPFGGLVGLVTGIWLFAKIGLVREGAALPDAERSGALSDTEPSGVSAQQRTRISRPVAVAILLLAGGIAFWGWYEFIRSPYLSHGFMSLDLQFRLPSGMDLPPSNDDVHVVVDEVHGHAIGLLGESWRGHDGNRQVVLATASLMYKTSYRVVSLSLPGVPLETWRLDLSYNPDPTPDFSPWRVGSGAPATKIEMSFRLRADR
jgi:hypothetical protein